MQNQNTPDASGNSTPNAPHASDTDAATAATSVTPTDDSIFSERGIETIFRGARVPQLTKAGNVHAYRVLGFHYEDADVMRERGIHLNEASRSFPDTKGVYMATIAIGGTNRQKHYNSFFPQRMSRNEVLQAITQAYNTRALAQPTQRIYKGRGGDLTIYMELDEAQRIIDAWPQRGRFNKAKAALYRYEQTGKRGKLLCAVCYQPKVLVCPSNHNMQPSRLNKRLRWFRRWLRWAWFSNASRFGFGNS